MNCSNCGAPMEMVRDRDYLVCKYCDHYYFPTADSEGVRLLGKAEEGICCPVCEIPLWVASFDGRYRGYACAKCRGTLLEREAFAAALTELRTWAGGPPAPQQPLDTEELQRRVRCPLCKQVMQTHPYYGPGVFAIDSCVNCDVVWLDYGEFREAVDAPGRDRGIGLTKRAERTAIGEGSLQLEPFGGSMNLIISLGELFKRLPL